jgi:hypothetical protein
MRWQSAFVAPLIMQCACTVSSTDRCAEGRVWSDQYKGCLDPVAANDAGGIGGQGNTANSDASVDAAQPGDSFGAECLSAAECTGPKGTYCLLDPTNPSAPGMCTVLNCTASDCAGTGTTCCDCTKSPMLGSVWPAALCVPDSNVATLNSIGCSCE